MRKQVIHPLIEIVVADVLEGEWGDGDIRKRALTAAGFNYDVVQREANRQVAEANKEYVRKRVWRDVE